MKCNLSFKSIVLIVSVICVSSQLSLYTLPKEFANLYGAACLDGSPPAFYYAPAADPAYASNFPPSWPILSTLATQLRLRCGLTLSPS